MPSDPTPTKRTEAEARGRVPDGLRSEIFVDFGPNDERRWGAFEKKLDAYAEAVRVAERERLAARVREMDAVFAHDHCYRVRKLDVLRLLTESGSGAGADA